MAQVADYNIANASGASVRSDLNLVFEAIKTLNSGGSDPSNPLAFMPYVDTADNNNLKIRNSSNNGFTTIGPVDTANLGLLPAAGGTMTGQLQIHNSNSSTSPGLCFSGDTDTGFLRSAANVIGVTTAGTQRMLIDQNGDIALGGTTTVYNNAKLVVNNDTQVVASFECQAADPQIYLGDNMSSAADNTLIMGYDRAENRGYLVIGGDADFAGLSVQNGGSVGVGKAATTEKFECSQAIKAQGSASNFNAGGGGTIIDFGGTVGRIGTCHGGTNNNHPVTFIMSGSEKARISESGKFLIGETVDITGAGGTTAMAIVGDLRIKTADTGSRRIYFNRGTNNYNMPATGGAAIGVETFTVAGGYNQEIFFETHHQGNSHAERMRIDKDGTVIVKHSQGADGAQIQIVNTVSNPAGLHLKCDHGNFAIYNSRLNANCLEFMDDGVTKMMLKPTTNTSGTQHDLQLPNSAGTLVNFFTGFHTTDANASGANANRPGIHFDGSTMYIHSPSSSSAFEVWTSHNGNAGSSLAKIQLRISQSGDVTNVNNNYGHLSDEKLKQDIVDSGSQWNDIKAMKIRKYKLKDAVSSLGLDNAPIHLGVVAQELEAAGMSGLVIDVPDVEDGVDQGTVTKSVKSSIIYMKAVKALQESMERIETLETKVAALESA